MPLLLPSAFLSHECPDHCVRHVENSHRNINDVRIDFPFTKRRIDYYEHTTEILQALERSRAFQGSQFKFEAPDPI